MDPAQVQIEPAPAPSRPRAGQAAFTVEVSFHGLRLAVSSNEAAVPRWFAGLVPRWEPPTDGAFPRPALSTVAFDVAVGDAEGADCAPHQIARDGTAVYRTRSWAHLQIYLERALLIETARHVGTARALVHAAAASRNGRGILMPARSKSGKSTLVAAMALSGFDYFTDEIAVLTGEGMLLPFSKAITLKPGGWEALVAAFPQAEAAALSPLREAKLRHLPPARLAGAGLARGPCPVHFVVLPAYVPGGGTSLRPVSRSEALARLVEQSLNLSLLGRQGMDAICRVVQQASGCYVLTTNDLKRAVALLEEALEGDGVTAGCAPAPALPPR